MTRADRFTAALLLAFAVAFTAGALKFYRFWDDTGPGSAFLPFWLGLVMAALAVLLLVRRARPADLAEWMPHGEARQRVLIVLVLTAAFVALLKITGMIIGTALYLALIIVVVGKHRWWVAIAVALAAAGFNWLVFAHWLRVPFPEGILWTF